MRFPALAMLVGKIRTDGTEHHIVLLHEAIHFQTHFRQTLRIGFQFLQVFSFQPFRRPSYSLWPQHIIFFTDLAKFLKLLFAGRSEERKGSLKLERLFGVKVRRINFCDIRTVVSHDIGGLLDRCLNVIRRLDPQGIRAIGQFQFVDLDSPVIAEF